MGGSVSSVIKPITKVLSEATSPVTNLVSPKKPKTEAPALKEAAPEEVATQLAAEPTLKTQSSKGTGNVQQATSSRRASRRKSRRLFSTGAEGSNKTVLTRSLLGG